MGYKVVFGGTGEFIDIVNDMIRDGWEPQGGVSVVNDSMVGYIAFQAMIKRDKE